MIKENSEGRVMTFVETHDEINSFVTSAYTMLRSTGDAAIERLEDSYIRMSPIIHKGLAEEKLDISVLVYSTLRLPSCIGHVNKILLGQSEGIFKEHGYKVQGWMEMTAKARRRRYLYDGEETLAAFIASKSDIDDILPTIISLQIEWNKVHKLLSGIDEKFLEEDAPVIQALGIEKEDYTKLKQVWGREFPVLFKIMKNNACSFRIRNLEASFCRYRRETDLWWNSIVSRFPDINERPVYFVSSNAHSLINVISGFAYRYKDDILSFVRGDDSLQHVLRQWEKAVSEDDRRERNNILYYLLKKFQQSGAVEDIDELQLDHEHNAGIYRIYNKNTLDIPAQVIDLRRIDALNIDTGLDFKSLAFLRRSNALILNIDYPLGRAAYFILTKLAEHVHKILGIYIIGKAASLTADSGDVLIPSSIMDQHTQNTYILENCIQAEDLRVFVKPDRSEIYDNQKAITVLGTFIQNKKLINQIFSDGVTDMEMESGPYLSALYEMLKPKRHPEGETISFRKSDIDLGIIHYVSDNPLRGKNLGDNSLSFKGIEGTYAATLSVISRIFKLEKRRVDNE